MQDAVHLKVIPSSIFLAFTPIIDRYIACPPLILRMGQLSMKFESSLIFFKEHSLICPG